MTELIELYRSLKIDLPEITKEAYLGFCRFFDKMGFQEVDFGKFFYIHFQLAHVDDQSQISQIYPLGKEKAQELISKIFNV